jgi:hypothetical protein
MSAAEREVLEWMKLGAGVTTAAINSDVSVCRVEDWIAEGRANPGGIHAAFSRQAQALEAANRSRFRSTNFEKPYTRRHRAALPAGGNWSANGNGNGSGGPNGQHMLSWDDL